MCRNSLIPIDIGEDSAYSKERNTCPEHKQKEQQR